MLAAVLAFALLAAPPAAAEKAQSPEPAHGLELGAGMAFALPMGDVSEGLPLSSVAAGQVPLEGTLGYRFANGLYLGGYFDYGWLLLRSCALFVSCTSSDMRFGLEGRYYFHGRVLSAQPWVGLGAGYEIAFETASDGTSTREGTDRGLELFRLTLGADFGSDGEFSVGPFLGLGAGRFTEETLSGEGPTISDAIVSPRIHFWAAAGVRLRFGPF